VSTLPASLVRFQSELEEAIGRTSRARRRALAFRLGTVAATAACLVLVLAAASLVTDRGPSVVDRATAALTTTGNGILHIRLRGERTAPDGTVSTWESEGWRAMTEPFAQRQVEVRDRGRVEWAFDGTTQQVYDARTNTIYAFTKTELGEHLGRPVAKPEAGAADDAKLSPSLRAKLAKKRAALARGATHAKGAGGAQAGQGFEEKFRDGVLELLASGEARVAGDVAVDGRDAVRIVSEGGDATYLVDARTYDPIEWRTADVDGGTTTLRFLAYEQLPGTEPNGTLVSLAAQHPTATVSHDASAAAAALGLLESRR